MITMESRSDYDMKCRAFYSLALLAALLGTVACGGQAAPTEPAQLAATDPVQTFEQEVERLRKELNIPGMSVAVLQRQEVVFARGYGQQTTYSFLVLKVPEEELTLLLLANSDGASAPFDLGAGNVLKSPFAVAFITLFTGIEAPSP